MEREGPLPRAETIRLEAWTICSVADRHIAKEALKVRVLVE